MPSEPVILCIEDENDLRVDIVEELEAANYTVLQASDGVEAIEVLEQHRPDLVLCDITMPGLGGYDVLKTMRDKGNLADVPFIFLTALADRGDVLAGKQAGADDYLVKPVDFDLLLATVSTRLAQVARVRTGAAQRVEEVWREVLASSRGKTLEALQQAALAFDKFLIGVAILDQTGAARVLNKEAERILAEDDGLILQDGFLSGVSSQQNARLQECVEGAFQKETADEIISFPRLSGRRPYLALVPGQRLAGEELLDAVVVLLIDTDRRSKMSGETLVRLYNLTPTETRVALMLIDGKRLDQIAEELDVAQTTIVFHLKNLFRKTNTHRQADLVRVLLSVPLRTSAE